jgi:hypothetical protein
MPASFTFRTLGVAVLASGLLLATGCRKTAETPTEDIATATDRSDANVETALSTEALRSISPAAAANASTTAPELTGADYITTDADFRARFGACATRTYDAATRLLTIDFGPTNCLCPDTRYRRGQILVQFTTDIATRRAGAVVTRRNYFVNDNQHTATRIFTDLGSGSFSVQVPSASVIYTAANGGGAHSWTANWTFTRTAGYGTATVLDDVYTVTGQAEGTNRRGISYTTAIQTPLIKRGDCLKYFVHGTFSISNANSRTLLLDYDPTNTQACDNSVSVTVNGTTKTITLR